MEHGFPSPFHYDALTYSERAALAWVAVTFIISITGLVTTIIRRRSGMSVAYWFVFCLICPAVHISATGPFERNWRHAVAVEPVLWICFAISMFCSLGGLNVSAVKFLKANGKHPVARTLTLTLMIPVVWFFLMLPSLDHPVASRYTQCKSNLKQIGMALHNYHDVYDRFPASRISTPPVSWRVQILPYLDRASLWDEYDATHAWDSTANYPIATRDVPTFLCPQRQYSAADTDEHGRYYTDYAMLTGQGAFSMPDTTRRFHAFTDGMSNTLAVVEACGLNIIWTEPRDADTSQQMIGINLAGDGAYDSKGIASSYHKERVQALVADGSVRFLSENMEPSVLKALTTINAEDDVSGY